MSATKILWGQILIVSAIVLATTWGATEKVVPLHGDDFNDDLLKGATKADYDTSNPAADTGTPEAPTSTPTPRLPKRRPH